MNIRNVKPEDKKEWCRLRTLLWPDAANNHIKEIEDFFNQKSIDIVEVFVIDNKDKLSGFIELNIRSFAEGSRTKNVPYIEGWYIDADSRRQGYGKKLIEAAENWSKSSGYKELGSDAQITNQESIKVHKKLGFQEIDRVVCFLKSLHK